MLSPGASILPASPRPILRFLGKNHSSPLASPARRPVLKGDSVIVTTESLDGLRQSVTMVDGGFDPLHPGHLAYFRAAAGLGLPLLCNVRDDGYLTAVKGRPPLLAHTARAELLDSLKTISYVHLCSTSTADVLQRLQPAVYAKGADWQGRLPAAETDLCRRAGIGVVFLDTVTESSTALVQNFLGRARMPEERRPPIVSPAIATHCPASVAHAFGCIGSTHMNRYLSGVARFNHLLAERLEVPCMPFVRAVDRGEPLLFLSVKLADCPRTELHALEAATDRLMHRGVPYALFFHSFAALPLERRLAQGALTVFAGNAEIARMLADAGAAPVSLWCPSLLDGDALPKDGGLTLFSFGMSHKMQPAQYGQLHDLLQNAGLAHTLLVSTAFHEKASFGDMDEIAHGFRRIFGADVQLLGFLSDAAVGHFLARADLFCAFFPSGVRANNTSVAAAMSRGAPVVTNLDRYSPRWMQHGHNVFDIGRLRATDLLPGRLAQVAERASRDVEEHAGWETLTAVLAAPGSSEAALRDAPESAAAPTRTAIPARP